MSMLPFLQAKKSSSVIVARMGKPGMEAKPEVEAPGQEMDAGLKAAAEDLLRAIDEKSVLGVASALKAAHALCESGSDDNDGPEAA